VVSQTLARAMVEDASCKTSDMKTTGTKLAFTMTCEDDDVRMVLHNETTVIGDSITSATKATDNEGRVTSMKMTGRRMGECPK